MANEQDITFGVNKYGEPDLLNLKNSVAQQIINALFMIPGNLPSLPHIGVNIKKYFYRTDTEFVSSEIEGKLKEACGSIISGVVINSVNFTIIPTSSGDSIFLLVVNVLLPNETKPSVLGISMKEEKQLVKFNFAFQDN